VKKRGRNRSRVSDWKSLMAALRRRDTISPAEIAQLVRQYTDVSPDYALRRLRREGVLQRLDPQRRGLYVVAGGKADAFIADRAAAVIFAHNHPSGELQPSDADLRMHDQLTEAGKILGLRVLDHVIVTRKGYYSFQEAGLIKG